MTRAESMAALGLRDGANERDIKRAYFQLIRQHSPDKDPDGFQKIRAAYEMLKDAAPDDEPAFAPPQDELLKIPLRQAQECWDRRLYQNAAEIYRRIADICPADPYVLYRLSESQLKGGNPGKSVKTAQRLLELKPDHPQARRLLATAFNDRGWYKKALAEERWCFEHGDRDLDLLVNYAQHMDTVEDWQGLADSGERFLDRPRWTRETVTDACELLFLWTKGLIFSGRDLAAPMRWWQDFIQAYHIWLDVDDLTHVIGASWSAALRTEQPIRWFRPLSDAMDALRRLPVSEEKKHNATESLMDMYGSALDTDPLLKMPLFKSAFEALYTDMLAPSDRLKHLFRMDLQLCAVRNHGLLVRSKSYIEENYPLAYAFLRDQEIYRLADMDEPQREAFYQKTLRDYRNEQEHWDRNTTFAKSYPEEMLKADGRVAYTGDTPFVRGEQKVGRNDPCPCGSGKKYKKCCMNKPAV